MNREIPGYYFDHDKKKYFKIEKTQTAPSSAAWSSDAVKRRKVEENIQKSAQHRAHLIRNHIKRHFITKDVVASALLAREASLSYAAERGRGKLEDVDLGAAAWADGLVAKGNVPFAPSFARQRHPNMPCFHVSGEDKKTGLGVAYATLDEESLVGSYIPTDKNDSCGLYLFSPLLSDPEDVTRPQWLLGETNHYQRLSVRHGLHDEWIVHSSTPAPPSSDLICVIGSNNGLMQVHSNETLSATAPGVAPKDMKLPQEIFTQDFQEGNHNVLLAGGRQPRLWVTDLRAPEPQWLFAKHTSSITHLKSVNPHQVIVSGLQSSMALYDVRFLSQNPHATKPLLHFPGHHNEAHIHIGWDVCPELNVVAAAQDNGTVKLFSLRSGRQLRCSAVKAIRASTPIKALMFQRMPRERIASLFIGEGPLLRKYSFGALAWSDEA
ncbi:myocyte-specific enhancer factor 2d [Fusarium longipes]|uniref:Myocyte-specific enhancer factor 2d n=1 Tax=Fusarium longipes TaxID=694270 RepID=A0A395RIV6_9HYPO|nr:myocyte-specific enhancer factor 2d [Fusarium longipes]